MSKQQDKLPAKWWAIGNRGGWGEAPTIGEAVAKAVKGGWAGGKRGKLADGDEIRVWEIDPAYPITHVSDETGLPIHRPEGSQRTRMGGWPDDITPLMKTADGKAYVAPKVFKYEKGAVSEAGRNLTSAVLETV